mmetsp:Transcript_112470/g.363173  ORF Transcript_112470/g.363173 Transcript_112470/m.363173 type:complete len:356 (-) Transcript_112470:453-1520(-)
MLQQLRTAVLAAFIGNGRRAILQAGHLESRKHCPSLATAREATLVHLHHWAMASATSARQRCCRAGACQRLLWPRRLLAEAKEAHVLPVSYVLLIQCALQLGHLQSHAQHIAEPLAGLRGCVRRVREHSKPLPEASDLELHVGAVALPPPVQLLQVAAQLGRHGLALGRGLDLGAASGQQLLPRLRAGAVDLLAQVPAQGDLLGVRATHLRHEGSVLRGRCLQPRAEVLLHVDHSVADHLPYRGRVALRPPQLGSYLLAEVRKVLRAHCVRLDIAHSRTEPLKQGTHTPYLTPDLCEACTLAPKLVRERGMLELQASELDLQLALLCMRATTAVFKPLREGPLHIRDLLVEAAKV